MDGAPESPFPVLAFDAASSCASVYSPVRVLRSHRPGCTMIVSFCGGEGGATYNGIKCDPRYWTQ